jgi:hypothetical protein
MRIIGKTAIVAACAALASGAAQAQTQAQTQTQPPITGPVSGYTYFNRPGATLDQHQHDAEFCFQQSLAAPAPGGSPDFVGTMARNPGYYNTTYGAGASLGAMLILGMVQAGIETNAQNHATRTNLDNCMAVLGWRVVQIDDATGGRMSRLERPALTSELQTMIAAENPQGVIERAFGNEAIGPATAFAPWHGAMPVSLSLRALPIDSLAAEFRPTHGVGSRAQLQAQRQEIEQARVHPHRVEQERQRVQSQAAGLPSQVNPITRDDLASLPTDATLIVIRMTGSQGDALAFTRVTDGKNFEGFTIAAPHNGTGEMILHVPSGRWQIASISSSGRVVSFCLGAPSFEAGPGEVVFAGAFSFAGGTLAPDLTLPSPSSPSSPAPAPAEAPAAPAPPANAHSPPKAPTATLASAPELVSRMRAASYSNGSTAQCNLSPLFYALEFPGRPFLDGYHWGSNASTAMAGALATATVAAQPAPLPAAASPAAAVVPQAPGPSAAPVEPAPPH